MLNLDTLHNMYVLDADYAMQELNTDFEEALSQSGRLYSSNAVKNMLLRVSRRVYGFIESHASNAERMRTILNTSDKAKYPLQSAMLSQLEYMINNGDLMNESGVNTRTGQIMDRGKLKQASMSGDAIEILENSVLEDGCPIIYQGYSYWRAKDV